MQLGRDGEGEGRSLKYAGRQKVRAVSRGALGVLGVSMICLAAWGQHSERLILGWALIAIGSTLVVRRAKRWKGPLELVEIWLAGFVYLFTLEWLSREELLTGFRLDAIAGAESFTIAAFGATLVGYWWGTRGTGYLDRPGASVRVSETGRITKRGPLTYGALLAGTTLGALIALVGFDALFSVGRTARFEASGRPLAMTLIGIGLAATPIALGFLASQQGVTRTYRVLAGGCTGLSLTALLLSGTRFPLGFAVGALLFYTVLGRREMRSRDIGALLLVIALLVASQSFMMASRISGVEAFVAEMNNRKSDVPDEAAVRAEGLLRTTAVALLVQSALENRAGLEHAFLLYWWVPRSIWPEKPTMAGHWLMREHDIGRGYAEGHSFSGGFAFAALIDFGPVLGVAFMSVYGWLLSLGERALKKARQRRGGPLDLFVAPLLFGVFFSVRSPFTALIFMQSLWIATALPIWLLGQAERGPRAVPESPRGRAMKSGPVAG